MYLKTAIYSIRRASIDVERENENHMIDELHLQLKESNDKINQLEQKLDLVIEFIRPKD